MTSTRVRDATGHDVLFLSSAVDLPSHRQQRKTKGCQNRDTSSILNMDSVNGTEKSTNWIYLLIRFSHWACRLTCRWHGDASKPGGSKEKTTLVTSLLCDKQCENLLLLPTLDQKTGLTCWSTVHSDRSIDNQLRLRSESSSVPHTQTVFVLGLTRTALQRQIYEPQPGRVFNETTFQRLERSAKMLSFCRGSCGLVRRPNPFLFLKVEVQLDESVGRGAVDFRDRSTISRSTCMHMHRFFGPARRGLA